MGSYYEGPYVEVTCQDGTHLLLAISEKRMTDRLRPDALSPYHTVTGEKVHVLGSNVAHIIERRAPDGLEPDPRLRSVDDA